MTALVPRGTPIAVVAPSGRWNPAKFEAGLAVLRDAGHDVHVLSDEQHTFRYLAADDATRARWLTHALTSPDYGAVWAVRGGYGITRLLELLPFEHLDSRPVIGFSDLTPLMEALRVRCGTVSVHGPVVHSLASAPEAAQAHLFDLLEGHPTAPLAGETWVRGRAEGLLVGGNLAMLAATCGTPWQVDTAGAILAIEDVGEAPYRIDRMLTQLRQAGVFDGVAGLALGTWAGCAAPEDADWSLDDVLRDLTSDLGVPVVAGLPFGHVADHRAFPIGAHGVLDEGTLAWTL